MPLIDKAIPTNQNIVNYLKSHYNYQFNDPISPRRAREVSQQLGDDSFKRDFICYTPDCKALITCRSLAQSSQNKATFVDQIRKSNQHIDGCKFSERNLTIAGLPTRSAEYSNINMGEIVSDISVAFGFQNQPHTPTSTRTPPTREPENGGDHSTGNNSGNTQPRRVVSHLKTLEDHVEEYQLNPNKPITFPGTSEIGPIKNLFLPITENYIGSHSNNFKIYYGLTFINQVQHGYKQIKFRDMINIGGIDYSPSFIVPNDILDKEYPDILDIFNEKETTLFKTFIVLPFILNGSYLNFSSYVSNGSIRPYSDELLQSFYISKN